MEEKRDSMIFYRSFYESLEGLTAITKAEVYDSIFKFGLDFIDPEFTDPIAKSLFKLIKPQLEANIRKFNNGKRPKQKQNESKPEANQKQNESKTLTNVNVNVNDNDNVNLNDNILLKKETKNNLIKKGIQVNLPDEFNNDLFIDKWEEWKQYKKLELKQGYKSTISEGKVISKLYNDSNKNLNTALLMIDQAVVNGWKGIYQINNNNSFSNGKTANETTSRDQKRNEYFKSVFGSDQQ